MMALNALLPEFEKLLEPHYVKAYNAVVVGRTLEHQTTIEEVRRDPGKYRVPFGAPSKSGFEDQCDEQDFTVEVGPHEKVPVRIYRPKTSPEADLPVHLNFHGGGWTVGTIGSDALWCRRLAVTANVAVFDGGYRLAPENKFPIAIEDSWAILQYIVQHADRLHIDVKRLSLGGVSAGGNIAAVLVNRCILKTNIRPVYLCLCVPVIDASALTSDFSVASDSRYKSWRTNYNAPFLSYARMSWFYKQYLPENPPLELLTSPELSPIYSLKDEQFPAKLHPPTFVCTAEVDVLCSEGESYAKALSDVGVPVVYKAFKRVPHNFSRQTALLEQAQQYADLTIEKIAAALDSSTMTNK